MTYEHATTVGSVYWSIGGHEVSAVDDPDQPDGDGWRLCSSSIVKNCVGQETILWFWERSVKARARSNPLIKAELQRQKDRTHAGKTKAAR